MQQIIREVEAYADSGMACANPRRYLEMVYDIRRNYSTSEDSYCDLAEQGVFSDALKQLVEYLFDEVMEDVRPSLANKSLVHSHALPALKPFEELTLSDVDLVSYNSDDINEERALEDECAAPTVLSSKF